MASLISQRPTPAPIASGTRPRKASSHSPGTRKSSSSSPTGRPAKRRFVTLSNSYHGETLGALAVGNVKYKTEAGLFEQMIEAKKPIYLDFRDAYTLAQKLAG